jgi:hypothetical protein
MLDLQCDARLLRLLLLMTRGEIPAMVAAAGDLTRWMEATGFLMYRGAPGRLVAAAAAPPPPADLPRLLWVPGPEIVPAPA